MHATAINCALHISILRLPELVCEANCVRLLRNIACGNFYNSFALPHASTTVWWSCLECIKFRNELIKVRKVQMGFSCVRWYAAHGAAERGQDNTALPVCRY